MLRRELKTLHPSLANNKYGPSSVLWEHTVKKSWNILGRYKHLRATMGISSARDEYNRWGDEALAGIDHMEKVVDDINLYDSSIHLHVKNMRKLLNRLIRRIGFQVSFDCKLVKFGDKWNIKLALYLLLRLSSSPQGIDCQTKDSNIQRRHQDQIILIIKHKLISPEYMLNKDVTELHSRRSSRVSKPPNRVHFGFLKKIYLDKYCRTQILEKNDCERGNSGDVHLNVFSGLQGGTFNHQPSFVLSSLGNVTRYRTKPVVDDLMKPLDGMNPDCPISTIKELVDKLDTALNQLEELDRTRKRSRIQQILKSSSNHRLRQRYQNRMIAYFTRYEVRKTTRRLWPNQVCNIGLIMDRSIKEESLKYKKQKSMSWMTRR
ncbi:unnamed protein product [Lepeophtheirus salmonis]|uniref:(salmon louse) hypothetical protein n=1 Tax=Lepeophtheirus salmonis TaxID=72036 RepID=A0A7R8CKH4_LEPSM|nr:unnamed protein product [Lepeophtheirus salmonis]CAF2815982.1 unnamed protein product [Lepeophtheirus salmonis]